MRGLFTSFALVTLVLSGNVLASKVCKGNWSFNGSSFTGWESLGEVSGVNKKRDCLKKAMARGPGAVKAKAASLGFPAINSQLCSSGVTIYTDTEVEGKRNSKDGSFRYKPSCQYGNGACQQYAQEYKGGSW